MKIEPMGEDGCAVAVVLRGVHRSTLAWHPDKPCIGLNDVLWHGCDYGGSYCWRRRRHRTRSTYAKIVDRIVFTTTPECAVLSVSSILGLCTVPSDGGNNEFSKD